jgi:acyl-CoA synthetase (NDP forming)
MSTYRLDKLFSPRSVVVVGASPRATSPGHAVLRNLKAAGFNGTVDVVNPHYPEIAGIRASKSLQELPYAPDVLVIAVPPPAVPSVVEVAGAKGCAVAIIITAGLGHGPNSLAEASEQIARVTGLRLVGPNCWRHSAKRPAQPTPGHWPVRMRFMIPHFAAPACCGVLDLDELFAAAETLGRVQPFSGKRLAILTNGGGIGVLAVDRLADLGGTLAGISPETMKRLDAALPPIWSRANPVDIAGDADGTRYAIALVGSRPGRCGCFQTRLVPRT